MERKKTKGRQKIPMKKIENKDVMLATFTKRREVMISPAGKPHSFFHPTVDAVISRFQNPNMQLSENTNLEANAARNKVNSLKNRLEELDAIKDIVIAKKSSYEQMTRQKDWWESIEQLSVDEVYNMHHRLNQLEIEVSSSIRYESFEV
ncbi:hypothetical protein R3W88_031402 [Solanum pinnatisectum]|uniref:MADS-box domain-containing protein n=1 Tax=Solanum pinnatisectum TaxID=50273 RepID=A0AAV9LPW9_9SOLN|nr:hypothetical protein R3W88_031402 [Solanum pinnatisectum]